MAALMSAYSLSCRSERKLSEFGADDLTSDAAFAQTRTCNNL